MCCGAHPAGRLGPYPAGLRESWSTPDGVC